MKEEFLKKNEIHLIRFKNLEVFQTPEKVIEEIRKKLSTITPETTK